MPPSAVDRLAALRPAPRYSRRDHPLGDMPAVVTIGGDDHALSLRIPRPGRLALAYLAPCLGDAFDVRRKGREVVARRYDDPSAPFLALKPDAVAASVRERLSTLPERADAGEVYDDLRTFAAHAEPERLAHYCRDTAAALRRRDVTPREYREPRPRPSAERAPALSPAQRKAVQREREVTAERLSSEWWLREDFLDPEREDAPRPGDRFPAPYLYARASEAIAESVDYGERIDEDDDESPLFREPRPLVFYRAADGILGKRRRTAGGYIYEVPAQPQEQSMDHLTTAVLDRVVDRLASEVLDELGDDARSEIRRRVARGDHVGALTLQRDVIRRERLATGTDGAPVDLAAFRSGRRSPLP